MSWIAFVPSRRLTASVSLLALSLAPAVRGQEATNPSEERLEELETQHIRLEQVVVTASPLARPLGQSIASVTVLDGEALAERLENSIGETLRTQPGISSTAFGAGASRPIIRGQGGDRIRVLEDGIGTFDAAQTSVDHAVPIEPALAQRIEVLRGAASLLYGSSAAGGVVNVDTGKIPTAIPENGYEAAARYSHSTVNNGDEVAGGFNVALGNFVLHGEAAWRDADDYEIPGLTASDALLAEEAAEAAEEGETFDPEDEFTFGFVPNSDLQTDSGAAGISYIFDNGGVRGFFGISASIINSNYGIPGHGHAHEGEHDHEDEDHDEDHEEEEEEEEEVRIDLEQLRYDIRGELRGDLGFGLQAVKLRLGYGDYRHVELEGAETGTVFENDEIEGRMELVFNEASVLGGTLRSAGGVQGRYRDFAAVGEEAFVPPSEQTQLGFFLVEELRFDRLLFDFGFRYENVDNSTDTFVAEEDGTPVTVDNDFNAFSISGGAGYQLTDQIFFGVNGFRTERAPSLEEQFSFGPHLATSTFEIGDPSLPEEVARGVEATVRGAFGPLTLVVNGFYTNYKNFIFEQETGAILDDLPVFQFAAADTEFRGFEAQLDADLAEFDLGALGHSHLAAYAQADHVRATSSGLADEDQPRIPPISSLFGLSLVNDYVSLRGEVEYTTAQNNIAAFELPTDDFVFVNLFLTVRPFGERRDVAIDIRARNINDDEGRVHSSFLKDTVPLPGRDVRFAVRLGF